jgi:GNAT superfamily N-acetyltransferase
MSRESGINEFFEVNLPVTIRPCVRDDLPGLEWYGLLSKDREIFATAFARQVRGEVRMLVAEANGFPVGQVWIDFARREREATGLLWALRVYPFLQGCRIGRRLVAAAERAIRHRGFRAAETGVEKGSDTRLFYERLGYLQVGELLEEYAYTTPDGHFVRESVDQWVFRKEIGTEEKV